MVLPAAIDGRIYLGRDWALCPRGVATNMKRLATCQVVNSFMFVSGPPRGL